MNNMENKDLQEKYDKVYQDSSEKFFSFIPTESFLDIVSMQEWTNRNVLDIGCGEGDIVTMVASMGAKKILGIDYSEEAIDICKKRHNRDNIEFRQCHYQDVKDKFDVIVMGGVLEHFDNPFEELDYIIKNNLNENGVIITSSPNFLNLRGSIWMTLQLLFGIPMTLTDLHFFIPSDFEEFCQKHVYGLEYKSTEQNWGNGEKILKDFAKRLPNALKDAGMEGNVEALLGWIKKTIKYQRIDNSSGAIVIYKLYKNKNSMSLDK